MISTLDSKQVLKNRTRKIQSELGLSDGAVRIIDWSAEVMGNPEYQKIYERIFELYEASPAFAASANSATKSVLENSKKVIGSMDSAIAEGVQYLLSEIAFMEFAPGFLKAKRAVYVYHRPWQVYEDYVSEAV